MRRFFWVFLALFLSWASLSNFIFSQYRLRNTLNHVRQELISIASNAALSINAQEVQAVPLQESADNSPAYQDIFNKLSVIKQTNPALKYAYILMATDQPGILQYVADADPAPQIITAKCSRALPGDKYDARQFPEMLAAYNWPGADKKITRDAWGKFISGYAPIRDPSGKPVAILGVDLDATGIDGLQRDVRRSIVLALGASIAFLFSLFAVFIIGPKQTV
jgi:hypothetical protein